MRTSRWLCAVLVAVLALSGVPTPWTARAEMAKPAYEMPAVYPYPGSARSAQSAMPADPSGEPTDGDRAGAAVLNIVYVPGKAIACGAGTLASTMVMLLTFGSGYRAAVSVFKEGCHGDWYLTPEHVSGKIPPRSDVD
jgi:hypothetical protein